MRWVDISEQAYYYGCMCTTTLCNRSSAQLLHRRLSCAPRTGSPSALDAEPDLLVFEGAAPSLKRVCARTTALSHKRLNVSRICLTCASKTSQIRLIIDSPQL